MGLRAEARSAVGEAWGGARSPLVTLLTNAMVYGGYFLVTKFFDVVTAYFPPPPDFAGWLSIKIISYSELSFLALFAVSTVTGGVVDVIRKLKT